MRKVLLGLLLIVLSFGTYSANLSQAQRDALKVAALAEPTIQDCITGGNDVCVSAWFNETSSFVVWRTRVTQEEYQSTTSSIGTQFDWAGTGGFIARSQGERDAWRTMFASGSIDPSRGNIRVAFNDIFSGSGTGAVNNRNHLIAVSKRASTQAEKALASGTGSDASPGLLGFEGQVGVNDIASILRQ